MIVKIATADGNQTALDETDFAPPSLGRFLSVTLKSRGLSLQDVATASGLSLPEIDALLSDQKILDLTTARKLEKAFPKSARSLLKIQQQKQFYEKYKTLRPDSPLHRALIEFRYRRSRV